MVSKIKIEGLEVRLKEGMSIIHGELNLGTTSFYPPGYVLLDIMLLK